MRVPLIAHGVITLAAAIVLAAVEILYLSFVGVGAVILANIVVRIVAAALFLIARRSLRS